MRLSVACHWNADCGTPQAAAALAKEEAETRESQMAADRRKYPVQEMRERVQELEAEVPPPRSEGLRAF